MARTDNLTNFLTDVATAIKTKKGDNTPISASNFDTEIANLPSGPSVTKGFIVNEFDENGYAIDISIVGITEIPQYYCGQYTNVANIDAFIKFLSSITLLGDITKINNYAFNFSDMTKLVLPDVTSVPTLLSNSLANTPIAKGTGYVYFPDSLVESVKSATNWSAIADQIKGVSEL